MTLNPADSVGAFLSVLQSGLVVSGNNFILVERALTSGDARTQMKASGTYTDQITLRLSPGHPHQVTGGTYTVMSDDIVAEVSCRTWYQGVNTSNVVTIVEQRVKDFKSTIASGTFVGFSKPRFTGETWPLAHEKAAKATLKYNTKYLL